MNLESEHKLKFDCRLHGRRDWVSDEELQAELDALPDRADNVLALDEEPESSRAATPAPVGAGSGSSTPGG